MDSGIYPVRKPKKNWRLIGYRHSIHPLEASPIPPLPREKVRMRVENLQRWARSHHQRHTCTPPVDYT